MSSDLMNSSEPRCIVDQPLIKLWYKIDLTFNVPRANAYFLITLRGSYSSIKNCVLTELFVNLLKDELNEILYQVCFGSSKKEKDSQFFLLCYNCQAFSDIIMMSNTTIDSLTRMLFPIQYSSCPNTIDSRSDFEDVFPGVYLAFH